MAALHREDKQGVEEDSIDTDNSTSQSGELIKKLEAELTCAVHCGRFDDPRVLPCLHIHCKKCVESLMDEHRSASAEPKKEKSTVVCPQCREEHTLPENGAGELPELPTFFQLVTLLEVYKTGEPGSQPLICGKGRDSNPAIGRCLECDAYLCDSCLELHKMQVSTRNHTAVTLDEIKETSGKCLYRPRECTIHKKELGMYCGTCSKVICGDCTKNDHKSHECVVVADVQDVAMKSLDGLLRNLRKLPEKAEAKKKEAAALMEKQRAEARAIHEKVDNTIEGLVQLLKERQGEIHKEIDAQAKKEEEAISADIGEAEQILAHLDCCIGFVDRLLQTASDSDLVSMATQTIEQCEKLDGIKIENGKTSVSEWDFDEVWQHSDGIAELKVVAKAQKPQTKVIEETKLVFKLVLVGDAEVGKSALVLQTAEETFSDVYIATIGVDFRVRTVQLDGENIKIMLWDTAGQERFRTITSSYYRGADGIILVYDVTKKESFEPGIKDWLEEVKLYASNDICKLLVGNKCDLSEKKEVDFLDAKDFADKVEIPFMEVSAKDATNVEQAFMTIVAQIRSKRYAHVL